MKEGGGLIQQNVSAQIKMPILCLSLPQKVGITSPHPPSYTLASPFPVLSAEVVPLSPEIS